MRIAYIDQSYHKKTQSTDFFFNILTLYHTVERFWDDRWIGGKGVDLKNINADSYDCLVLFQIMISRKILKHLGIRNVIYVPMYDTVWAKDYLFWKDLQGFKILSFSKILHERALINGLDSFYSQYWPEPYTGKLKETEKKKIFFWQRNEKINFEMIDLLFSETQIEQIHFHYSPDPNTNVKLPGEKVKKKYKITFSKWFNDPAEFLNLLDNYNIFIAPRIIEGIGLSFLVALSRGMLVVGNNSPTMNEYINNGINGYLFDSNDPKPLDIKNIDLVMKKSLKRIKTGHEQWLSDISGLLNFISRDIEENLTFGIDRSLPVLKKKIMNGDYSKTSDQVLFYAKIFEPEINLKTALEFYRIAVNSAETILDKIHSEKYIIRVKEKLGGYDSRDNYHNLVRILDKKWISEQELIILFNAYIKLNDHINVIKTFKRLQKWAEINEIRLFIWFGDFQKKIGKRQYKYYYKRAVKILRNKKNKSGIDIYNLGSLNKKFSDYKNAKRYFKHLIKDVLYPEYHGSAYFHLGDIASLEEKTNEAIKYFKKCLELMPEHRLAGKLLEELLK